MPEMTAARVRKRSVRIAGHATSVSLEDAFWRALAEIARRRGRSLNALIADIDAERHATHTGRRPGDAPGNLSSAIRVFVLENTR